MALLVVGYPKLHNDDFHWIQKHRRAHDARYYSVIDPHFTFVFPISKFSKQAFVEEVQFRAADLSAFEFELNISIINQDISAEFYHEFLVPDKGYTNIVKCHDRLYAGLFNQHLRQDIDFIPHIGIGNSKLATESNARVDRINEAGISIRGLVDTLDIIEFTGGPVQTIEEIPLG